MKSLLLFLLLLPVCMSGQNMVQAEYFFDTDPGYGRGIKMNFEPKQDISFSANLYIGLVSPGFHTFFYRFKDDINGWGQTYRRNVLVGEEISNLSEAEYFFDTDPGYGKGIKLQFGDQKEVSLSANLYFGLIPPGLHTFFYRINNGNGWGNTFSRKVFKPATSKITKIIYWCDDGQEENVIGINPVVFDLSYTETIDIKALEDGLHLIHFQVENENGFRSRTWTTEVLKSPKTDLDQISSTEPDFYPNPATDFIYFKDNLSAEQIKIVTMEGKVLKSMDSAKKVAISELSPGIYLISYRIKNQICISPLVVE